MRKLASTAYLILLNVLAADAQQDTTTATLDEVVITAQRRRAKPFGRRLQNPWIRH